MRASRSSSQVAVIFPIAQSEPTVRTIVASTSRFAPVAVLRSAGRLAQVAQLDTVLLGQLGEAGNVVQANVEAVLEIEALR